jgi:hypothetical protein
MRSTQKPAPTPISAMSSAFPRSARPCRPASSGSMKLSMTASDPGARMPYTNYRPFSCDAIALKGLKALVRLLRGEGACTWKGHALRVDAFQTQQDAKAFARAKLADGPNVNAANQHPRAPSIIGLQSLTILSLRSRNNRLRSGPGRDPTSSRHCRCRTSARPSVGSP